MSADLENRAPDGRRNLAIECGCYAAVLGFCLKLVGSIESVRDIGLSDESIYLAGGARLFAPGFPNEANGLVPAEWGPVYSFWYAFLHLFQKNLVQLYFSNWSVLVVLTSLGTFALQRSLGVRRAVALLVTWALTTSLYFEVWPYPVHFAVVLLLGGATLAVRAKPAPPPRLRTLGWPLLALLLCTYVRPEFAAAFVLDALYAAYVTFREVARGRLARGRFAAFWLSVALALAGFCFVFGVPVGGGRAYYAFGQHYALNIVQRTGLGIDPWGNWVAIATKDFGAANTIGGAIRANPAAFARHVWYNLSATLDEVPRTMEPNVMLGIPVHHALQYVYAALMVLGTIGFVKRARSSEDGPDRQRLRRFAVVWAVLLPGSLFSMLVIHPRLHYILPLMAFTMVGASAGLETAFESIRRFVLRRFAIRRFVPRHFPRHDAAPSRDWRLPALLCLLCGLLLVTPSRAHGWCPQVWIEGRPRPTSDRMVLHTIDALAHLGIARHVVVLEATWGYAFYGLSDFELVPTFPKKEPFLEFLRIHDIGVIVRPDLFVQWPSYADDPQYAAFVADPSSAGFRSVEVQGAAGRIAIRNDIHVAAHDP